MTVTPSSLSIPSDTARSRARGLALPALLIAEGLILWAARLPLSLSFDDFVYGDPGSNLTVQDLLDRGYRPGVDFGYPYGLLSLVFGRVWFGMLGRTPAAYAAAMLACLVLICLALARIAQALRVGAPGAVFLVVTLPVAVMTSYPSLPHALEAVLISTALAEQAQGRRSRALAILTAGLFVKATMCYFYGLWLLICLVADLRRTGRRDVASLARALLPSVVTGVALLGLTVALFGPTSALHTLFPFVGVEAYRHRNFGFFHGIGRYFWHPPGARLGYYLKTIVGFWIAGSIGLLAAAVAVALGRPRAAGTEAQADLRGEIVLTCALLHTVFVTWLFAHMWSWYYYSYLLIIGLVAIPLRERARAALLGVFSAAALLGLWSWGAATAGAWVKTRPVPELAGLWASAEERREWLDEVIPRLRDRRAVNLSSQGGMAERLFPTLFAPPTSFMLNPGYPTPSEVEREADRLATADAAVVPTSQPAPIFFDHWPLLRAAFQEYRMAWDGKSFRVYFRDRRRGPTAD